MDDARDIVNAIHNACEWGSFETADACLEKYTKEKTRLAKIEVLEELLSYRASFPIHAVMDGMLSKLRAGN